MKDQEFYVLKDEEGKFYPLAFCSPVDMAGDMRKEEYEKKKLDLGETIVKVKIIEV